MGRKLGTVPLELQTFRTQDLSFPRTKGPYGELSFPRNESSRNFRSPGTKVPENEKARERKFQGTFVPSSRERKVSGTKVPHRDYSFLGTKGLGHEKSRYRAPLGGAGSLSNTKWPGPRRMPTSVPSFILIHPTVWPQYTNVSDRTGQTARTDRRENDPVAYRVNRFTNGRRIMSANEVATPVGPIGYT